MRLTLPVLPTGRPALIARVVLVVGAYVTFYSTIRYALDAAWALPLSQVLFLLPVGSSAAVLGACAVVSPSRSRSRRVWGLLALSALAVFVGEASWSYAQLFDARGPQAVTGVFDAANVVAMASVAAAIGYQAGIDRLGWRRGVRIVLDGVALVALAFGVLYRFWATQLIVRTAASEAVRLSAYGVLGLLLLAGDAASFGRRSARHLPHNAFVAASVALIALGVAAWAGTGLAYERGEEFALAASSILLLAAYCLMSAAGWVRLSDTEGASRAPIPAAPPAVWPGVLVSALVFGAVVWLGVLALESGPETRAQAVYLTAASIAAACAVGRTALAYAEADELNERSLSDPLTGVRGPRAFDGELQQLVDEARESRGIVALCALDIDDFARVNAVNGYRAGDRCLVSVARSLAAVSGSSRLFRLSGDEFIAIARVRQEAEADRFARSLLAAVRGSDCEVPLTASVGVALLPDDTTDTTELLRYARLAGLWAKRHGKDRNVRFEQRIADTLSLDERLARPGERARMDMARALLAAADARDPANHWHARNVAALVRLLAEDLGFDAEHIDRMEMAAILHDVGKIALPDVMLGGRTLTFQERSVSKEHSRLGERLVESLSVEGVGRWVRAHHEHWDGSGYPDGLAGGDIPLESRIIALADAYDGMTMGKRYGAPMSKAAALQEIDLGIGVRFDPGLAEDFIRVVGNTGALGWSDEWPST